MKKYILLLCVAALFITCKKDKKVIPAETLLDVTGTWTLYAWHIHSGGVGVDASVAQYPCMAENVLKINTDHTTNAIYSGSDSCYVTPQHGQQNGATAIGMPGQPNYSSTWKRTGNNIYIGTQHYVISASAGRLYLTASDTTVEDVSSPIVVNLVNIKQ